MTDYTELKRTASASKNWGGEVGEGRWYAAECFKHPYFSAQDAEFIAACDPGRVLALIAENERLAKTADCWGRLNIQNKALSDSFRAERDQLKAEVAQLQEENENLRTCSSAVNASVALENEALRKDSESYRLLSFCHGQGTLELVRSHHELCAEIRRLKILAGEPVPPTPEEFVGPRSEGPTARIRRQLAAMGKGEQS